MIGFLVGNVLHVTPRFVVLNVGGVGYKVYGNTEVLGKADSGGSLEVWTHLVVKEDALDLYGFLREPELEFFQLLLGVSGVGPRSALGVIDIAPVATLQAAIASGDSSYLTKVSGIGKKSAEKIILELRDKVGEFDLPTENKLIHEDLDVLEALNSLGFTDYKAREALNNIPPEITGTSKRVSEALKYLGG